MNKSVLSLFAIALLLSFAEFSNAESEQTNDKELESFNEPLLTELKNGGFGPNTAKVEAERLMAGLRNCWHSEFNVGETEEREVQTVTLGGTSIFTYKSPCLDAFVIAIEETVASRSAYSSDSGVNIVHNPINEDLSRVTVVLAVCRDDFLVKQVGIDDKDCAPLVRRIFASCWVHIETLLPDIDKFDFDTGTPVAEVSDESFQSILRLVTFCAQSALLTRSRYSPDSN